MSEHTKSQAKIEVLEPWRHGAKSCNMCWFDVEPDDVKLLSLSSPTGQGLITLALCQQHRHELRDALGESVNADLLAALEAALPVLNTARWMLYGQTSAAPGNSEGAMLDTISKMSAAIRQATDAS